MPKTRRALSNEKRAERRRADRAFAAHAVEQLRSSHGWQQWLTARRHFHAYSLVISSCVADALRRGVFVYDMSLMGVCAVRSNRHVAGSAGFATKQVPTQ